MRETRVRAVRHVALNVPNVERSSSFLEKSWGLTPMGEGHEFRGAWDGRPLIKLSEQRARGIDHISFAAASQADVDSMAERVRSAGLRLELEPHSGDDGEYSMRCRDGHGLMIEVAHAEPRRAVPTRCQPFFDPPMLISHVVLNTPDLEATSALYCELFGFEVSDRAGSSMNFLRCNEYHHSLAFSRAEHTSLNHVAFEVGSIDSVIRNTVRLKGEGREALWGPGRHGPGDNVFAYFSDPNGLLFEYTSGLEIFDDDDPREARVWSLEDPEAVNSWGTGPPSADAACAMLGEPDPFLRP